MKKLIALFLAGLLLFGASACESEPDLYMPTGCADSYYLEYGKSLATKTAEQSGPTIEVYSSDGSKSNMIILDNDPERIGLAQLDVLNHSWNETHLFKIEGKIDSLRAIGAVFTEQILLVTTDPSITSITQLMEEDTVLSLGSVVSGSYFNAIDILGLDNTELKALAKEKKIKNYNLTASLEALAKGEIDAAFITSALPSPALTSFMEEHSLYAVPMGLELIDTLKKGNADYFDSTIPADTFTDQKEDIPTLAVKATLICGADTKEEDIYALASLALAETDLTFATEGIDIPFHKGAAKYYADKGVSVVSK